MKVIYLKTTETCNLDCDHCFTSGSKGAKVYWDVPKVRDWIRRLDLAHPKDEPFHFELHGGEPFICPISELIDVINEIRSMDRECTVGVNTNLVYKMSTSRKVVFSRLDVIGTSWDKSMRFKKPEQLALWEENVRYLVKYRQNDLTLSVSIDNSLIQSDYKELLQYFVSLGINRVRFERITYSGNAIINRSLIPTNKAVSDWLLSMYQYMEESELPIEITNFEELHLKVFERMTNVGTYLRSCEQNLITMNADGTLSGCPNDAPTLPFSKLTDSIEAQETAPKRMIQIAQEQTLKSACYECDLLDVCGGGCYKVQWDETGCPTPKDLMYYLKRKGRKHD